MSSSFSEVVLDCENTTGLQNILIAPIQDAGKCDYFRSDFL